MCNLDSVDKLFNIKYGTIIGTLAYITILFVFSATDARKLTFMYLANDVIQNSKKKGPEYNKEFGNKLGKVFEHLGAIHLDEKSLKGLNRLLSVWEERNVFEADQVKLLKQSIGKCKNL